MLKIEPQNKNIQQRYLDYNARIQIKHLRVGISLAFVLFFVFLLLDYIVYPDQYNEILSVRIVNNLIVLTVFIATYKIKFSHKGIKYANIFSAMVLTTSISAMIMVTEGALSPYYAGLNLVLIGASILFFFDLGETVVTSVLTILVYVAACAVHYMTQTELTNFPMATFFNNFSFLTATAIICSFSSYYLSRNRFETFQLNYQLELKNQELEEMDKLKSDFFANTSHELRTPLTMILAPVQSLLTGDNRLSDKENESLGMVRDNAMRLLRLVNHLLDMMRLDSKHSLEKSPQNLSLLLANLSDNVAHLASTKQIAINKDIEEDLLVNAEQTALEKILLNLLSNAIKFSHSNAQIDVIAKAVDDAVIINIHDTGIGISQKAIPHIFERFRQADGSSTRRHTGTGLGLALVKELLAEQDGKITVQSELNKGTTFTVSLPRLDNVDIDIKALIPKQDDEIARLHLDAQRFAGLSVEDAIDNESELSLHPNLPKLLIVDDEPDIRRYLKQLLSSNYCVLQARDGKEGLQLVKQYQPDLLLLDMMLPEIDGLTVCKKLKQSKQTQQMKIIFITARGDDQIKIDALSSGADDFLTKPFSAVELQTRLNNLLNALKLEKALKQHNQQLAQALNDLKAAEAQLLHSEKLSAIGSLASGLLHEVNNPLNYTITAAQILKSDPNITQDADTQETLEDIIEGMDRIKTIVRDLHTFAYPEEADKQTPFVLLDALNSALRFTSYDTKSIDIAIEVSPELVVIGSHNHIVQVFINLITNAAKALADKQNAQIKISAEIIHKPNQENKVLITLRDNGKGMDEATMSRIFEPFYTTREVGEGLGMGLSICYTIIKNHNSTIQVDSKLGEFTEFSFSLPLAQH